MPVQVIKLLSCATVDRKKENFIVAWKFVKATEKH